MCAAAVKRNCRRGRWPFRYKPSDSALVCLPLATSATSLSRSSPSWPKVTAVDQRRSVHVDVVLHVGEGDAVAGDLDDRRDGVAGRGLPRPVENTTTCAPPATIAATDDGIIARRVHDDQATFRPRPAWRSRTRPLTGLWPPLWMQPSDFSSSVVMPPALLPGAGIALAHSPRRPAAAPSHSGGRSRKSGRAPPGVAARRARMCSAPISSVVSDRIEVPPAATRSDRSARPISTLAARPLVGSEPPHSVPRISSEIGNSSFLQQRCFLDQFLGVAHRHGRPP